MKSSIIAQQIFEVRGQKIMLDFDLAEIYQADTKALNQAVKRNKNRFPKDFMFRLTQTEWKNLRSQFVTSNRGGRQYLPYAFTEHGVTMLACVLRSKRAAKMSIAIVRAFIILRKTAHQFKGINEKLSRLHERLGEHDIQLSYIYDAIENLLDKNAEEAAFAKRPQIGFRSR
jgi:phage regulator Rha-like protein